MKVKRTPNVGTRAFVMGGPIALALWSSCASARERQSLLDKSKAFAALPRMKHTPAFGLFDDVMLEEVKDKQKKAQSATRPGD
jgi:hypothetical protein